MTFVLLKRETGFAIAENLNHSFATPQPVLRQIPSDRTVLIEPPSSHSSHISSCQPSVHNSSPVVNSVALDKSNVAAVSTLPELLSRTPLPVSSHVSIEMTSSMMSELSRALTDDTDPCAKYIFLTVFRRQETISPDTRRQQVHTITVPSDSSDSAWAVRESELNRKKGLEKTIESFQKTRRI